MSIIQIRLTVEMEQTDQFLFPEAWLGTEVQVVRELDELDRSPIGVIKRVSVVNDDGTSASYLQHG